MRKIQISIKITDRETENFSRYLNEIRKFELLTPAEEFELVRKVKQGDQQAKQRLICSNTRFVVSIAKAFSSYNMPLGDLVSEGSLGLIASVEKFDGTRGFKFITFAVWNIQQQIYKCISDNKSLIKIPGNQNIIATRIRKATQNFEQKNCRLPSNEEIAELCNLSLSQVRNSASNPKKIISLDNMWSTEEGLSLVDLLVNEDSLMPDHFLMEESRQKQIQKLLGALNDTQRIIVNHFFGLGQYSKLTLEEIAKHVKLSKESVRKIKDKSIKIMIDLAK